MKIVYKVIGILVIGAIVPGSFQVLNATSLRIINHAQYNIPQGIVGPTIVKYSIGNIEITDANGFVILRDDREVPFGYEKTVEFNTVACPFTVVCDLFIPGRENMKKVTYHVTSDCDKNRTITIGMHVHTNQNGTFKDAYPIALDSISPFLIK